MTKLSKIEEQITELKDSAHITERELEEMYDDMLDEVYGVTKIAGLEYQTSDTLGRIDPTAYRCGFNDWLDSQLGETIFEIDGEYFNSDISEEIEEIKQGE